jgi:hypothetical protein
MTSLFGGTGREQVMNGSLCLVEQEGSKLSFSAGVADVITGGDLYDGDLYAISFYDGES